MTERAERKHIMEERLEHLLTKAEELKNQIAKEKVVTNDCRMLLETYDSVCIEISRLRHRLKAYQDIKPEPVVVGLKPVNVQTKRG